MCAKNAVPTVDFGPGELSLKTTGGAIHGSGSYGSNLSNSSYEGEYGCTAPAEDNNYGLLVGSGVDAESFEDYVLQSRIGHGTGAGKLVYVASEVPIVSYEAGPRILKDEIARYFNNNSGASIDVNEVALVFHTIKAFNSTYDNELISRDKLPETVTVPDTGQLKVTYTIQLTYPS
ncbi:unnamed protein product [marine sediment metagenome]|uniref:Uncharacterized protein n=1 Tax=marine sediment metagenome TaxID=412755 RepID=X1SSF9_9ZZZZ